MSEFPMTWEEAVKWLREQPDQGDLVRDCFFDDPVRTAAERYHASGEWRAVREFLGPARSAALDIGSGRGISAFALAKDGWQTTALEPDPSDLVGAGAIRALVADSGLPIDIVSERGESLPFADSSFDLVHCRQVLHHASDLPQLCREVGRVLKPGGVFIATREHVISTYDDLPAFLDRHPLHRLYGGEHAYLLKEYLEAIAGGGLAVTHCFNPFASEINRYPATMESIKKALTQRLLGRFARLVPARLVPDAFIVFAGSRINTPGRPFTFVARKPEKSGG